MSNKTIQLNPSFLSTSSSKSVTPKREKKMKPQTLLKPNTMKKHLLAKIKDFQNKSETNEINVNTTTGSNATTEANKTAEAEFESGFADEFNKSLNFLSELSKQRKQKPKRNETLKRGRIENNIHLQIATELPEDMRVPVNKVTPVNRVTPVNIRAPVAVNLTPQANLTPPVAVNPPTPPANNNIIKPTPGYSNLKNGSKPSYRQFHNITQKIHGHNSQVIKPLIHIDMNEQDMDTKHVEAQHVEAQHVEAQHVEAQHVEAQHVEAQHMEAQHMEAQHMEAQHMEAQHMEAQHMEAQHMEAQHMEAQHMDAPRMEGGKKSHPTNHTTTPKQRFKRRITRTLKYSLGKHKNGKVSVLIKNAKTRRKVQTEQALLKQKSIAEIKSYLREKNLLKVGSEVPNDVLRQLYENAILAGDVTNKSKDTLIHNYFNERK